MSASNRWWRNAVCLLTSGLLVTGAAWLWPTVDRHQETAREALPPSLSDAPEIASVALSGDAEPDAIRMLRRARAEGAHAWRTTLAIYQAPEHDRAKALGFLLQLDAKGLSRLATSLVREKDSAYFLGPVGDVFFRWSELDPTAALALAETLTPPYRALAIEASLDGFIKDRPADVCAYLTAANGQDPGGLPETNDSSWQKRKLTEAVTQWSGQDPAAAARFYDQRPGAIGEYATRDIAGAWVKQDPATAMDWVSHLPAQAQSWALQGGLKSWAQADPASALQYYNSLTNPADQQRLARFVAEGWSDADPQEAAQWVIGLEISSRDTQPLHAALDPWVQSDPAAATTWASGLTSAAAQDLAWPTIAAALAAKDASSAEQWLATLPAGENRDDAVRAYCWQAGTGNDPVTRLDWAGQISSAQSRDTVTVKILKDWLTYQPQAAQQWIDQANLPATVTSKLKGE